MMSVLSIQRPFRLALRWLLVTLIGALLTLMIVQVVMRYGFNASLLWAEEICRYMLIWLSFLAAVLAYERGEVASLTFLSQRLPRVPALLLAAFCAALSMSLCLLLARYGWIYADRAGGAAIPAFRFILEDIFSADASNAPGTFWVYVALPVGMALLAARLLADTMNCLIAIRSGQSLSDILELDQEGLVE